jgi:nucleoside-diphosphate-sugar epimerase
LFASLDIENSLPILVILRTTWWANLHFSGILRLIAKLNYDDPKQRNPDISRAKSILGWEPVVKLEDGIEKTAAWMKQNLQP